MRLATIFLLIMGTCSCTLLRRDQESNEIEEMSESVLKHKEGLEIDFKPIKEGVK